tara:strand:- start:60 stop:233 length:174 start_codon:yes stop_codon:yes gene_type:complete
MNKTKQIIDHFNNNIIMDREYKLLELKKELDKSYNKFTNINNKLVYETYIIKTYKKK